MLFSFLWTLKADAWTNFFFFLYARRKRANDDDISPHFESFAWYRLRFEMHSTHYLCAPLLIPRRWFLCVEAITQRAHNRLEEQWPSHFYTYIYRMYHGEFGKRQMNAPHSSDFWYFSPHILTLSLLLPLSFFRSIFILLAGSWTVSFMIRTELSTVILAKMKKRTSKGNILSHRRMNRTIEKK